MDIKIGDQYEVILNDCAHPELRIGTVHTIQKRELGFSAKPIYVLSTGWYAEQDDNLMLIKTPNTLHAILVKTDT